MKKDSNKLLIVALLIVSILTLVFVLNKVKKSDSTVGLPLEASDSVLENKIIATDPNFEEAKGYIYSGFPVDFPVYPGAELIGSAKVNPPWEEDQGYRVRWDIKNVSTTLEIINWYKDSLYLKGWDFEDPNDTASVGEIIAHIENSRYKGYIAAELEEAEGLIELIVDLRLK